MIARAWQAGQGKAAKNLVDEPAHRDPPRWHFWRAPTRAEAWAAMRVVLARMSVDGLRALRELPLQDP
jgi:hypothetical protein